MGLGQITLQTPISHTEPTGVRFDVQLTQPSTDKPMIGLITYQLDAMMFKDWLTQNEYLCKRGPAIIVSAGITVTLLAGGVEKWDKAGFHIQNGDQKIYLELVEKHYSFTVHRDIISPNEWACHMVEVATAAQELKNEVNPHRGGDAIPDEPPF